MQASRKRTPTSERLPESPIDWNNEVAMFLDASTSSCGVFIVKNRKKFELFTLKPKDARDEYQNRIFDIVEHLGVLMEEHKVTIVVIENVYTDTRNVRVAQVLANLQGAIILMAMLGGCKWFKVNPTKWKAFFKIAGTREEQKAQGLNLAMNQVDAKNDDEADAYLIGKYFIKNF